LIDQVSREEINGEAGEARQPNRNDPHTPRIARHPAYETRSIGAGMSTATLLLQRVLN
jgi:hypothetical protein